MTAHPAAPPELYEGGAGSPPVLMHGFGASWHMWKPLQPLLEPHHRVIVPTLPGHVGGLPFGIFGQPLIDRLERPAPIILPDCGHNPVYDNPARAAAEVLALTRSVDAATPHRS